MNSFLFVGLFSFARRSSDAGLDFGVMCVHECHHRDTCHLEDALSCDIIDRIFCFFLIAGGKTPWDIGAVCS